MQHSAKMHHTTLQFNAIEWFNGYAAWCYVGWEIKRSIVYLNWNWFDVVVFYNRNCVSFSFKYHVFSKLQVNKSDLNCINTFYCDIFK